MKGTIRKLTAIVAAAVVLSVAVGVAHADDLENSVANGGAADRTMVSGSALNATYSIQEKGQACDAPGLAVTINTPTGVTATPNPLSFNTCDDEIDVAFTSTSVGSHSVTHTLVDSSPGQAWVNDADFTLNVRPRPPVSPGATGGDGEITVNWSASPDASGIDGYRVFLNSGSAVKATTTGLSATITGLTNGQQVCYSVKAYKGALESDATSETCAEPTTASVTDTTPPTLTVPANITETATSATGNTIAFDVTATDNVAGVTAVCSIGGTELTPSSSAAVAGGTTYSFSETVLGTVTVSCQATDVAGNKSDSDDEAAGDQPHTFTISVTFGWSGFFQPVDMTAPNSMKSGATAPMKFTIANGITDTAIVSSASTVRRTCSGTAFEDALEVYATGGTSLRYDTSGQQFIYNWQSPKGKANYCYRVVIVLTDDTEHFADFNLK